MAEYSRPLATTESEEQQDPQGGGKAESRVQQQPHRGGGTAPFSVSEDEEHGYGRDMILSRSRFIEISLPANPISREMGLAGRLISIKRDLLRIMSRP